MASVSGSPAAKIPPRKLRKRGGATAVGLKSSSCMVVASRQALHICRENFHSTEAPREPLLEDGLRFARAFMVPLLDGKERADQIASFMLLCGYRSKDI